MKQKRGIQQAISPVAARAASNDVFVDERGLILLLDRVRGFHILGRA